MNLKFSGLFLVLTIFVGAVSGLAVDNNSTQIVPSPSAGNTSTATQKPQNAATKDEGPVVVSDAPVSIIIPKASEIIVKSTAQPNSDSATTTTTTTNTTTTTTTTTSTTPSPDYNRWVVRGNGKICIIAQMAMELNVTYPANGNPMKSAIIDGPGKKSNVTGSCGDDQQSITIKWDPGHSVTINFEKNKTVKNFYISGMSLIVNASVFKDSAMNSTIQYDNDGHEFMTPLNMSYKCSKMQNLTLNSKKPELKAVVTLSDTQLEAFANKSNDNFETAQDCETFDTPDIVPIAVGCALAILVLVVLVVYLIGRKRSHNSGYLSM